MADVARPASEGVRRCEACGTPNPNASYVLTCLGCGKPLKKAVPLRTIRRRELKPEAPATAPRPRGRWLARVSWAYALAVLAVLILVRWVGDAWWGVTPLLFSPRWVFLLPVALLALLSATLRCWKHWVVQGATAAVVAGPLMGLSVPVQRLWERAPAGETVRVASFNLGLDLVHATAFARWLERQGVTVVCLQEGEGAKPALRAALASWQFNSTATIASRLPIVREYEPMAHAWNHDQRYSAQLHRARMRTPGGREFVVASVHLPTVRPGLERLAKGNVEGLKRHVAWWGSEMSRVLSELAATATEPMVVVGDFNMPSDDSTMAALRSSFVFAFEEAGWGYGYTRPARYPWVRIDHILASPEWSVRSSRVGPDFSSDHLPVMAELVLPEDVPPAPAGRAAEPAGGAAASKPGPASGPPGPGAWRLQPGARVSTVGAG